VEWKAKYGREPSRLAVLKGGKVVLTEKRETTGPAVSIRLTADRTEIDADGEDVAMVTAEALDKEGRAVPTASNLISFRYQGPARCLAWATAIPTARKATRVLNARFFSGLAQAIVQSSKRPARSTSRR